MTAGMERQNALILHEPPPSINPIPLQQCVQRIEIRPQINEPAAWFLQAIIEAVEEPNRNPVERELREVKRHAFPFLLWAMKRCRPIGFVELLYGGVLTKNDG